MEELSEDKDARPRSEFICEVFCGQTVFDVDEQGSDSTDVPNVECKRTAFLSFFGDKKQVGRLTGVEKGPRVL
jgi:hypothetical protein